MFDGSYPININDNLCGVTRREASVFLDKPITVGFCILDISKLLMYDFHYNTIKKQYKNKASLLFTDTDSLTYEIETDDIYKDMEKDKQLYDFSDYQKITHCMTYLIKNLEVNLKMKHHLESLLNL